MGRPGPPADPVLSGIELDASASGEISGGLEVEPEGGVDQILEVGLGRIDSGQLQRPVGAGPVKVGQISRGEGGPEAPAELLADRTGHLVAPERAFALE